MLVVRLSTFDLRVAILVELFRLLLDFRLAAKQHTLRADDARAAAVGERGEDVEDERVVAVASRGSFEGRAPAEAAERILEALFAEDLLLEPVLLLLVVGLLLQFQPPDTV